MARIRIKLRTDQRTPNNEHYIYIYYRPPKRKTAFKRAGGVRFQIVLRQVFTFSVDYQCVKAFYLKLNVTAMMTTPAMIGNILTLNQFNKSL